MKSFNVSLTFQIHRYHFHEVALNFCLRNRTGDIRLLGTETKHVDHR
jgi:hypothetical protein